VFGFRTTPKWLVRLGLTERAKCDEVWRTFYGYHHRCYLGDGHRGSHGCTCGERKVRGT